MATTAAAYNQRPSIDHSTPQLLIYSTVRQVQPQMQKLYTGPDAMFSRATCANCEYIAINAKDCQGCHKVVCGYCI